MSIHIEAQKGEIAETILLPGDPLRAKFVAENFFNGANCYNKVRGMLGYTGFYHDKKISVQGTGMGIPSMAIYATELIREYNVKNLIRIGSCGSIQKDINLRDIVLAMSSSTDSSFNKIRFPEIEYAPTANFDLLKKAYDLAKEMNTGVHVGSIVSSDSFYSENTDNWKNWAKYGILAVEMETTALYTLAAKYGVKALSILTVSNKIDSGEETTAEEREKTFTDMIKLAIKTATD
ncbi:MAG: purine-nucleoside phosphorylase [Candidatus Cloacimonetes bacterium]|nr:purine-nucleoside phosphorylase [Candidatus Cloacimonadota bacterium]